MAMTIEVRVCSLMRQSLLFYLQELQGYQIKALQSHVEAIYSYPGSDWVEGVIEIEAIELPMLTNEALNKAKDVNGSLNLTPLGIHSAIRI